MTTELSRQVTETTPHPASGARTHVPEPRVASPGRQLFHTIIAGLGWAIFAYWWWIVFHRVSAHEVRFTLWFVGVSLVVCVLATGLWVIHNRSIFRRRGPRSGLPGAVLDYSHDPLGRTVSFELSERARTTTPVVRVLIEPDRKTYRNVQAGPSSGGSAA